MKRITYYPGCTLSSTAFEYGDSTLTVLEKLGVKVEEIPDWNCCGAASAKSLDHRLSILIPARNLKNAASLEGDVYVPCAGCYNNLMKAKRSLEDGEKRKKIEEELGAFSRVPEVYPLMNLFFDEQVSAALFKRKIATSVKVAAYYGCAFLRPDDVLQNENPELPSSIDRIMKMIGVETVEWPLKSFCCGGDLSLADSNIVAKLSNKIITYAKEAGAEAIVTGCPLCQANLEMRQTEEFPVFYFTEIIGIALGVDKDVWWTKHLVDPTKIVKKLKG
ncbi:MAG: CoB--CoM heterodisulfide reductase iron-sulfur subunit B family protein [bacterium]